MSYLSSNADFLAELAKRGIRAPTPNHQTVPDFHTPADGAEALPDFLRAQAGGKVTRIHPLADHAIKERWTLEQFRSETGMNSSAFGQAMEQGLSALMVTKYSSFAGDAEKFSRLLPVSDFKPVGLATLDIKEPAEVGAEDLPLESLNAKVTSAGTNGVLRQFGGKIAFSRPVMSTYGDEIINGVGAFASVFWAIEQKMVATLLSTGTVGTASGGVTVAGLAAGTKALRAGLNQAGQMTGLPPYSLVCAADDEIPIRVLIEATGGAIPKQNLAINPHLAAGTFYLIANPALHPGMVRMILRGQPEPRIYSDTREIQVTRFALSFDCSYALTAAATSAIVKVTA